MQVPTDRGQRFAVYLAQLTSRSLVGDGSDLLRHGIRDLLEPCDIIGGDFHVGLEVAITGSERHGEEQTRYHRVAAVRYDNNRTYPALLTACHRIEVAEQQVTADQELYSGYSSAAVIARSARSADIHSATSARYSVISFRLDASLRYPASMPCHIISSRIARNSEPRLRPCASARTASLSRTSASTRIVVIAIKKVYAYSAYEAKPR